VIEGGENTSKTIFIQKRKEDRPKSFLEEEFIEKLGGGGRLSAEEGSASLTCTQTKGGEGFCTFRRGPEKKERDKIYGERKQRKGGEISAAVSTPIGASASLPDPPLRRGKRRGSNKTPDRRRGREERTPSMRNGKRE